MTEPSEMLGKPSMIDAFEKLLGIRRGKRFIVVVISAVAVVGFCCAMLPNFSAVAVVPGITFVVLQWIAFRRTTSQRFFLWTDYLYYGVIGIVVLMASLYLRETGNFYYLNQHREKESLTRYVETLDLNLKSLRQQKEATDRPIDEESVKKCANQRARKMRIGGRLQQQPLEQPHEIDWCNYIAYSASMNTALPALIQEAERRLKQAKEKVVDLGMLQEPPQSTPSINELERRLILVPTLALFGLTLKLGKTTAALFAPPRLTEGGA